MIHIRIDIDLGGMDGDQHTAKFEDFINLAESICGFGDTQELAVFDLLKHEGELTLFEKLADIEHQRWADWQKYLHSKCIKDENGNLIIPAKYVGNLEYKIATLYSDLSESDKESDREQVKRYWDLVK